MDKRLEGITHGISVRQPWAWLIAAGWKDIENRSQCFKYRGPVAIHASKTIDDDWSVPAELFAEDIEWKWGSEYRPEYNLDLIRFYEEGLKTASRGAIIGIATIVGCVHEHDSRWFVGPHGLLMNNPELFDDPIPWRGALGIWELKESQRV